MAKRTRTSAADYEVGYGRPPKATQFKKGECPNKAGRPKGSKTIGALLNEIFLQKIAVTEKGKTRRLTAIEIMLRRLANDAMRNEPSALKLALSIYDRYSQSTETGPRLQEILAEDREILGRFLKKLK